MLCMVSIGYKFSNSLYQFHLSWHLSPMDWSKLASMVYNKIAKQYAKTFCKPSEHIDKFLSYIQKPWTILDIGCGAWVDAWYMVSLWHSVIGTDFSSEMIALAKEKFPDIDFTVGDARKLVYPPGSFDGILAACFLIHIPKKDVSNLLKLIYSLLKKDWVFYISLQSGTSAEVFIDEPFKPDEKLFLNIISYSEISELLQKTWFTLLHTFERAPGPQQELPYSKLYIIAQK